MTAVEQVLIIEGRDRISFRKIIPSTVHVMGITCYVRDAEHDPATRHGMAAQMLEVTLLVRRAIATRSG